MSGEIVLQRFAEYSRFIRGYSPKTVSRYTKVGRFFLSSRGVTDISQVTGDIVRAFFYDGRQARNWSVNTFLTYHKTLRVFFRWCVKEGYLASNPTVEVELPKLEQRLPAALSRQNALRLLEVVYHYPHYPHPFVRERNYAIFATFLFAGLRRQELLNLKLMDIDLANRTLFVRQGKGNKDRIVPIAPRLQEILQRYVAERAKAGKTCPEFFPAWKYNQGVGSTALNRMVILLRNASGIRFSVHRLRHAFATLMLEGGCDIYSLSRMLGHRNIQTTTIYLSATAEHLRTQITKHPLNTEA